MNTKLHAVVRRTPWWALLLLIVALLLAQQEGNLHRIAHAGWSGGVPVTDVAADDAHTPLAPHDCAAYDAATLGHGPPILLDLPVLERTFHRALPAPVTRAAASGCAAGFHSRAPPRA